ncbi:hypothetical protein Cflav_PD2490 [Pedosphaera parvula Ellin514]|uniref:Uncharacterized protein n=1 Tax=Pedosphaera parvula (strain Ellin514) TaxID=320771 RepID=B9XKU0_PEDPL|nr:hypothetical protein Cflav_PD2490 [Pedosphaera parvula Ellin514]
MRLKFAFSEDTGAQAGGNNYRVRSIALTLRSSPKQLLLTRAISYVKKSASTDLKLELLLVFAVSTNKCDVDTS